MGHCKNMRILLFIPVSLVLVACGSSGGSDGSSSENVPDEQTSDVIIESFSEREEYAQGIYDMQDIIKNDGKADPVDLVGTVSYQGNWAVTAEPNSTPPENYLGGPATLEANFDDGKLTGTMEQEILDGLDGALTIQNGQINGADLNGDLTGVLIDREIGEFDVNTTIDGFFSTNAVQGDINGTATGNNDTVNLRGGFTADEM